jgi:hypothetical protein
MFETYDFSTVTSSMGVRGLNGMIDIATMNFLCKIYTYCAALSILRSHSLEKSTLELAEIFHHMLQGIRVDKSCWLASFTRTDSRLGHTTLAY